MCRCGFKGAIKMYRYFNLPIESCHKQVELITDNVSCQHSLGQAGVTLIQRKEGGTWLFKTRRTRLRHCVRGGESRSVGNLYKRGSHQKVTRDIVVGIGRMLVE